MSNTDTREWTVQTDSITHQDKMWDHCTPEEHTAIRLAGYVGGDNRDGHVWWVVPEHTWHALSARPQRVQ